MAVRRQHPEPENPPQDDWRAGPGGVPIPPKTPKLRKRQPTATVKFEKPTAATRAEVRLAAIHCVLDEDGAHPVTRASTARSRIRKNSLVFLARCVHTLTHCETVDAVG